MRQVTKITSWTYSSSRSEEIASLTFLVIIYVFALTKNSEKSVLTLQFTYMYIVMVLFCLPISHATYKTSAKCHAVPRCNLFTLWNTG